MINVPESSSAAPALSDPFMEWMDKSVKDITLRLFLHELRDPVDRMGGGRRLPPDTPIIYQDETLHIHCECSLLAYLQDHFMGHTMTVVPYIGVSKSTCILCALYMKAFNKVVATPGQQFSTRCTRTDGTIKDIWCSPALSNAAVNGKVQVELQKLLSEKVRSRFYTLGQKAQMKKARVTATLRQGSKSDYYRVSDRELESVTTPEFLEFKSQLFAKYPLWKD
ncbi:hypothetical protein C8Q75DRAFT_502333 [Abortiporus biennis]|nr:hypothetical protein C8Q75DRAFT_502333 [Abortiporus biennis]